MKITQVSRFKMQWLENYEKFLTDKGHAVNTKETPDDDDSDVMVFHWCDENTINYVNGITKGSINSIKRNKRNKKYVVFVRRYEIYSDMIEKMNWDRVDAVVMVNDYLAEQFEERTKIKPFVIYNGVDPMKWNYEKREHGEKIAWVGYINQKKNIPLAIQILNVLPEGFSLHIAGAVQDAQTMDYMYNLRQKYKYKIVWHGKQENIDGWLEDKNYILSTAISEGCPNNVIEAMAKGIKPIVHEWPGASKQFDPWCFRTVSQARELITSSYNSELYREKAIEKFGWSTYEQFYKMLMGLFPKTASNPSRYSPDIIEKVLV